MARSRVGALAGTMALALGVFAAQAQARDSGLEAYKIKLKAGQLQELAKAGYDVTEARDGDTIEVAATAAQATKLKDNGFTIVVKRSKRGETARQFDARVQRDDGSYENYRPYWDDTYVGRDASGKKRLTLYQELRKLAQDHPNIVKTEIIGRSVNDVPILALKVTRNARDLRDGARPAVLYSATQHAREWITPEEDRRLAHYFVDNYGKSTAAGKTVTPLVNSTELWFVVVANPDGYDFTFTPGNRLWRKNLRDNNGDGQITTGDGVDPNRNFAQKWNYDDEGSSSDPASETYRGTGPASEPETRAMDGLQKRVKFKFQVNYHSAAELLLYPFGWQVETPSADDPIFVAMSGTDDKPAIDGQEGTGAPDDYDPDLSAELYTTNGETIDHVYSRYKTLGWTPEMDVSDPDRGGGESVFEFQDSASDLQDAFDKNLPFALDVAKSAKDPANPVERLGIDVPDFVPATFAVSYGDPQTVEVNAKRELGKVRVRYQINGGATKSADTAEWTGGERFGGEGVYFHRLRGVVSGAKPGDKVKVWFESLKAGKRSEAFTYTLQSDTGNSVLVLSAEDYGGVIPNASPFPGPAYLDQYKQALEANGVPYDVYDVDAQGRAAPDRLGVLAHYKAVVWYTGDDQLVREVGAPGQTGTSKLADDEIINVRSYINEGGKLLYTGEHAATPQLLAYQYNPAGQPPFCKASGTSAGTVTNCPTLSNDFLQYYLGAYVHLNAATSKEQASGLALNLAGGPLGTAQFTLNGGDSADNQEHTYSVVTTSSILPESTYPQFASDEAVHIGQPPPFDPPDGQFYAVAKSNDESYQRLRRTIDLTNVTSTADLSFKLSHDTEETYDFVFVEAHTVGQDDWTTLPDANGNTSTDVGSSCDINWDTLHPFLAHYQTNTNKSQDPAQADCTSTGTTGSWNAATGNSSGFKDWKVDLSAYKGKQVEISITYAQDFGASGLGVFLDQVQVTKDGQPAEATSFETDLGGFEAGPAPEGSENDAQWQRSESVGYVVGAGVATPDTLYWGFGFEGVSSAEQRTAVMRSAMQYLGAL
jgi:zinc carboxypeptidase/immune inhibitor InhA-like protein